jgi:hypothetical protein
LQPVVDDRGYERTSRAAGGATVQDIRWGRRGKRKLAAEDLVDQARPTDEIKVAACQ